ncbi:hypothetical protein V6N12_009942 [Hibiscus sabdariffa]|uniref:Uncharacterized protein n=1 Tax=Hibiscus sabdariffa TaxID=183260 RepID=A0ABR2EC79_9ROSI
MNGTRRMLFESKLIKGIPPPLSGTKLDTVTGGPVLGVAETIARRGLDDHGYTGEDVTVGPLEVGAGTAVGDNFDKGIVIVFWEVTPEML